jgi:hypothetical protein
MNWHLVSIRYGVRVVNHIAVEPAAEEACVPACGGTWFAAENPTRAAATAVCDSRDRADRLAVFSQDGHNGIARHLVRAA